MRIYGYFLSIERITGDFIMPKKDNYSAWLKQQLNNIIDEMATNPSLFAMNPNKDFTRKRDIDFKTLINIILSMAGNSINKELYDYFKSGHKIPTSSAFVQQRGKLLPSAFEYLFHEFNNIGFHNKTYNGYYLYACDGTDVNIARNPQSETYISFGEKGYNQFHVNAMYDVLNKVYVDAIVQPRPQIKEARACCDMVDRTKPLGKTIILCDRGYESFNLFEHINRKKDVNYLIRTKNAGIKEIANLPLEELDTTINIQLRTPSTNEDKKAFAEGKAKCFSGKSKNGKDKKMISWDYESPYNMKIHVVRFKISDDNYETIATNLNRFEFPIDKIKELYGLRWNIETSFRELKYTIGLINFHAKREDFVLQEIFAGLIMYNFCERIILHIVVNQSENRKHDYQVNFTMGMHICMDYFRHTGMSPPNIETLISKYILPVRKGRKDERKLKPKSFVYFLYRVA